MPTETQVDIFDSLQPGQSALAVERMVQFFREQKRPIELFEALKMRTRHHLGLPLIAPEDEARLVDDIDRQLETGLLDACREVGEMMFSLGRIREGWMYLRPTGDVAAASELLKDVEATDENADDLIQVLLHEGVDVGRGFQLLIDRNGTCNSITAYEQQIAMRGKRDRQAAARKLLDHFYGELCDAVRGDISRHEAPAGAEETLGEMLQKRAWLVTNGGYHLDTTHLSSVIRIARVLNDPPSLQRAWELTQYGRRLDHQFQYPGDEPFVDFYPSHSAYFNILLGRDVELGLDLFQRKATTADTQKVGTAPMEVYVDLLDRCGRHAAAIDMALKLVPDSVPPQRIVPLLIEMAQRCGHFQPILEFCRKRGDVLGYVATSDAAEKYPSAA
ncbi:MAG: hypothetical protein ACO1RT_14475 [Planctomycetaceae bacterium]